MLFIPYSLNQNLFLSIVTIKVKRRRLKESSVKWLGQGTSNSDLSSPCSCPSLPPPPPSIYGACSPAECRETAVVAVASSVPVWRQGGEASHSLPVPGPGSRLSGLIHSPAVHSSAVISRGTVWAAGRAGVGGLGWRGRLANIRAVTGRFVCQAGPRRAVIIWHRALTQVVAHTGLHFRPHIPMGVRTTSLDYTAWRFRTTISLLSLGTL